MPKPSKVSPRFNDVVYHKGNLYGLDAGRLYCLDAGNGELRWKTRNAPYGTGQGLAFQISAAYWAIVRSLENRPEPAILKIAFFVQPSPSA